MSNEEMIKEMENLIRIDMEQTIGRLVESGELDILFIF